MRKNVWIVLFLGCVLMGFFVWGEAQRAVQNPPLAGRQYEETKLELARLKAEVERLGAVYPYVSQDGNFFFFLKFDRGTFGIYWMDASGLGLGEASRISGSLSAYPPSV